MAYLGTKIARKVNEPIAVFFSITKAGALGTGLSGTITVQVYDEAGVAFSTPAVTEPSTGLYKFTFTPDAAGDWTATMVETGIPAATSWHWIVDTNTLSDDTDDIQTRLPAALVSGRMDSSVGAMAAGTVTAAAVATGAIDADALATDAVAEIADGVWDEALAGHLTAGSTGEALSNAAAGPSAATIADAVWDEARAGHVAGGSFGEGVASVVGNVGGNVVGSVGSVAAGGITAASIATDAIDADAIAASAVTEIQAGLAPAAALAVVQTDTDDIQTRLPATLNAGRMRSHVEAMDAGTITAAVIATGAIDADALAADAGTEIGAAVDVTLTASHGAGSWQTGSAPPTVGAIADAVWDETLAGHLAPGSTGEALDAASSGGAGLTAQQVRDAMKLAPTAGAPAVDSIDEKLDTIPADVDTVLTAAHGAGSWTGSGGTGGSCDTIEVVGV